MISEEISKGELKELMKEAVVLPFGFCKNMNETKGIEIH